MAFDCQEIKELLTYLLTYDLHIITEDELRRRMKTAVVIICIALLFIFLYVTLHQSWLYSTCLTTVTNATVRL